MTDCDKSPYLRDVALIVSLLRAYVYIFSHTKLLLNCVVGWFLDDGPESLEADSLLVDGFCSDGPESLEADSLLVRTFCGEGPWWSPRQETTHRATASLYITRQLRQIETYLVNRSLSH
jgi:hypothetical protein